jgi:hypothetical protein
MRESNTYNDQGRRCVTSFSFIIFCLETRDRSKLNGQFGMAAVKNEEKTFFNLI